MNDKKGRGPGYWLKLITVGLVGGLMLACLGIEVIYVMAITRPARKEIQGKISPADMGHAYEQVTFSSPDGIDLKGWVIPSQNGAGVILLHGLGGDRTSMLTRADMLARHGYGVLLYDLRAHGESEGDTIAFGWPDVVDATAAVDYLAAREDIKPGKIGMLGFSLGGQIALRAAAEDDRIQALTVDDPGFVTAADAPPPSTVGQSFSYLVLWADWIGVSLWTRQRPPEGIPAVVGRIAPRPVFFISSGGELSKNLNEHFYAFAGEPKELWLIPEAGHGGTVKLRPVEYEERMIEFFGQALTP